jgi:hypothetical protein
MDVHCAVRLRADDDDADPTQVGTAAAYRGAISKRGTWAAVRRSIAGK